MLLNALINWASLSREENVVRSIPSRTVGLLASILYGMAIAVAAAANAQPEAITATVIGEKVQKVGYRALIQKRAIMYNLAGYARNNPDGTVGVSLQGDKDQSIRRSKRSAPAIRNRRKPTSSVRPRRPGIQTSRRSPSSVGRLRAGTSQTPTTWFLSCDARIRRHPKGKPTRFGTRSPRTP